MTLHSLSGILHVAIPSIATISAVINNACSVGNLIVKTAWAVTQATFYISGASDTVIIDSAHIQIRHSPQHSVRDVNIFFLMKWQP